MNKYITLIAFIFIFCFFEAYAGNTSQNLDLILKCESTDKSWIFKLSNEGFFIWNDDEGVFNSKFDCSNDTYTNARGTNRQGDYSICEIRPTYIKMDRRYMQEGFSDPDRDYSLGYIHVDRTNGAFKWQPWERGTEKVKKEISGTCNPTEMPKPKATKF